MSDTLFEQAVKALNEATGAYEAALKHESEARSAATSALNELNRTQKALDEMLTSWRRFPCRSHNRSVDVS